MHSNYRNKKECPCYSECKDCAPGFQKVVDLKNAGLVIYRHTTHIEDVDTKTGNVQHAVDTTEDVYILHNTTGKDVSSADYWPEIEQSTIKCPRCRKIKENAGRLLKKGPTIIGNDVKGICDHCKMKDASCYGCLQVVKSFVSSKPEDTDVGKERVKHWLGKIKLLLDDTSKDKNLAHSDIHTDQPYRNLEIPKREPDVVQLFGPHKLDSASSIRPPKDKKKETHFPQLEKLEHPILFKDSLKREVMSSFANEDLDLCYTDSDISKTMLHAQPEKVIHKIIKYTTSPYNREVEDSLPAFEKIFKDAIPLTGTKQRAKTSKNNYGDKTQGHEHGTQSEKTDFKPTITKQSSITEKYGIENKFFKPDKQSPRDKYGRPDKLPNDNDQWPNEIKLNRKANLYTKVNDSHDADHHRKYKSTETLVTKVKDITLGHLQTNAIVFPHRSHVKYIPKQKSSSEFVKNTADKLLVKAKEEKSVVKEHKEAKQKNYQKNTKNKIPGERTDIDNIEKHSSSAGRKVQKSPEHAEKTQNDAQKAALIAEKNAQKAALIAEKNAQKAALTAEKNSKIAEKNAQKAALIAEKDSKTAEKNAQKAALIAEKNSKTAEINAQKAALIAEKNSKTAEKNAQKAALIADKNSKTAEKNAQKAALIAEKNFKTAEKNAQKAALISEKNFKATEKNSQKAAPTAENNSKTAEKNAQKAALIAEKNFKTAEKNAQKAALISEKNFKATEKNAQKAAPIAENNSKTAEKNAQKAALIAEKNSKRTEKNAQKAALIAEKNSKKAEKDAQQVKKEARQAKNALNDERDAQKAALKLAEEKFKKAKDYALEATRQTEMDALKMTRNAEKVFSSRDKLKKKGFDSLSERAKKENNNMMKNANKDKTELSLPEKRIKSEGETVDRGLDDLVSKLVKLKQLAHEGIHHTSPDLRIAQNYIEMHCEQHTHQKNKQCLLCANSDLALEFASLCPGNEIREEISDIIVGQQILKVRPPRAQFEGVSEEKDIEKQKDVPPDRTAAIPHTGTGPGYWRYALSDRKFIDNGWTQLPTEKVVRKMNVYRMRPSRPEFDWFENNRDKQLMKYDTGEKLAEFDEKGRGRWFYKNGRMALVYYDAEEQHAGQRFVVYSNGEPDERGRSRRYTLLATFDYLGNGIVFDHSGKIRLKYNQTEGVVLDRSIGPVSHWKWHTLNDPPVLQQVMLDTELPHKDPGIMKMGKPGDDKPKKCDEDMLAIEFDNIVKEKSKKLSQAFRPFQIRMKALKINEHFSLRVLDQATVYLLYRDGTTNLKLNIGMVLDNKEIVDTVTADVGDVSNNLEKLPARTESLADLQKSIARAQRYDRMRTERERKLNPGGPNASVDKLVAGISRPIPHQLLTTAPSGSPIITAADNCKCNRKPTATNMYYDTRFY